jgi:cytochrome c
VIDLEKNKILAAILLAGVIAMFVGNFADILYKPEYNVINKGFKVEVNSHSDSSSTNTPEQKIDLVALLASANAEDGQKSAKKCAMCHNFEAGAGAKVGPDLWQIYNAKKARSADFSYSKSLQEVGGVWDDESLYKMINNPRKLASGTKMSFAGISKPEEVANVIAYLKTLK